MKAEYKYIQSLFGYNRVSHNRIKMKAEKEGLNEIFTKILNGECDFDPFFSERLVRR